MPVLNILTSLRSYQQLQPNQILRQPPTVKFSSSDATDLLPSPVPPYTSTDFERLLAKEPLDLCDRLLIPVIHWFHTAASKNDPRAVMVGTLKTDSGIEAVRLQDHNKNVARLISMQTDTRPEATVGLVYKDGTLKLKGEKTDQSFWNTDRLWVDMYKVPLAGRVGVQIVLNAVKQAQISSMQPALHKTLHIEQKITGKGIKSLILDVGPDSHHAKAVAHILNDSRQGIAPAVNQKIQLISELDFREVKPPVNPTEAQRVTFSKLKRQVAAGFEKHLRLICDQLESLLSQSDHNALPDVFNLSQTCNASNYYHSVDELLNHPSMKERMQYTQQNDPLLQKLMRTVQADDRIASAQATVNFVDETLLNDQNIQAALERYQQLVGQLNEKGVSVVVANGNEDQVVPDQVRANPEALMNWLTKSDGVITVAGSFTGSTPWDFKTHRPAAFSNTALAANKPTLTGPAVLIPAVTEVLGMRRPSFNSGTSLAAPFVGGTIALMKEANPLLTPPQIKQLLQQACENPNLHDAAKVGAGYLNPIKAVELAKAA